MSQRTGIELKITAFGDNFACTKMRIAAKPQQNAYIERYNRTVRNEWLDQHIIRTIEEAQKFATQWFWMYNNERPNMGIGGITLAQKMKMAA